MGATSRIDLPVPHPMSTDGSIRGDGHDRKKPISVALDATA
jgi:hypothetical protein